MSGHRHQPGSVVVCRFDRPYRLLEARHHEAEQARLVDQAWLVTRYDAARAARGARCCRIDGVLEILSVPLLNHPGKARMCSRAPSNLGSPARVPNRSIPPPRPIRGGARLEGEDRRWSCPSRARIPRPVARKRAPEHPRPFQRAPRAGLRARGWSAARLRAPEPRPARSRLSAREIMAVLSQGYVRSTDYSGLDGRGATMSTLEIDIQISPTRAATPRPWRGSALPRYLACAGARNADGRARSFAPTSAEGGALYRKRLRWKPSKLPHSG